MPATCCRMDAATVPAAHARTDPRGSVDYGKASPNTLTEAEKDAGLALFCCATPRTDLLLECKQITHSSDIPVKKLPCRVQRLEKVASDVMILEVKLPASENSSSAQGNTSISCCRATAVAVSRLPIRPMARTTSSFTSGTSMAAPSPARCSTR